MTFQPIGIIHSKHTRSEATPIQPIYARGIPGQAEIYPEYADGLRDLDGFSHIYLLYHFHKSGPPHLIVTPFLDDTPRGVFATRAPRRPNPIGLSLVRLVQIAGRILYLEDVDILDGTPLLDIKPYTPRFDLREDVRCGWQEGISEAEAQQRGRRGFQAAD